MLLRPPLRPSSSRTVDPLADLFDRGVLRRFERTNPLPGEVGSGYKSGANLGHVEPEEIFLLGTSHISNRSAVDVERAIVSLCPDAVVIELCRSRTGLLYADDALADDKAGNAFGLSGDGGPLQALQRSLALGGWAPLLLRVLLVRLSSSVGGAVSVTPGADFRAAKKGAEALDATLVLGDRPVEITLERAWRALSWGERSRVISAALTALSARGVSSASASATALLDSALGDGESSTDALDAMEAALASQFPSLIAPLIAERDVYLSLTLKSSRAVSGKRRVLGVVGRGHLDGVVRALGEEHTGGFKTLTWTPSRAATKQKVFGVVPRPLATRLAVDTGIGLGLWWWWSAGGSGGG